MNYRIKFPIGDWSNDGHGKCDWYSVLSNKPVKEVREIHFKMKDKLGFTIHDFANKYQESKTKKEFVDKFQLLNLNPEHYFENFDNCEEENIYFDGTKGICQLWIDLLIKVDPYLQLKIKVEEDLDSISFYGYDKQNRHIPFVGYGLFD